MNQNSIIQPEEQILLTKRKRIGDILRIVFGAATIMACLFLLVLLATIFNNAFGAVALKNEVSFSGLTDTHISLETADKATLITVLEENLTTGMHRKLRTDKPFNKRTEKDLRHLVEKYVLRPEITNSWSLMQTIFEQKEIENFRSSNPGTAIHFRSWVSPAFITSPQSSRADNAGIRTAILGSLWMIIITILFAFPVGIGAAIYLNEMATDNKLTRFIQLNIYNLAGIPSIIYGLLGLAIFVRVFEPVTSGAIFGAAHEGTANGRTILSAGLTMGVLILPIIIINAQEALKALPDSLRLSALGIGATKWQMIWHHLLPSCIDRILTGSILAISRAIGETAPLVVIGASTFITLDPSGVFSKFTALPIQIYQWSARPQAEFQHLAAGAIIVLLVLLLSMNTFAIVARNKYSARKKLG